MKVETKKINLRHAFVLICFSMIAVLTNAQARASYCDGKVIIVHTSNPNTTNSTPVPHRAPTRNFSKTIYIEFLAEMNNVMIIIRNSNLPSESFNEGNVPSGFVIPITIPRDGENTIVEFYSNGMLIDSILL